MSCTGLLGGTFNPPHNGHVLLAATAKKRFDIDSLRVHVSVEPAAQACRRPRRDATRARRELAFPDDVVVRDDIRIPSTR